jgi:quinol monooxygenase YgiN
MSLSLIVSGIGAVAAAVGSGVLLARCFRSPRGDLIAWSIALLGLLISLGAQTLGHLAGFDSAMFRATELGGQVVAPMALILALSEVAARSMAGRFCARLYIPSLTIVAFVILALDPLADVAFTKAWPDPATYYQTIPDYVLMYAIAPVTVIVAVLTTGLVMRRAAARGRSQAGWKAVLPAQLMGALAALALAYPPLQELVGYKLGIHLPIKSEFSALCTLAVALTWLAGVRTGHIRLAVLHDRDDAADRWPDAGTSGRPELTDEFGTSGLASEQGVYRGGGLYRPERPDQNATARIDAEGAGAAWQGDQTGDIDADWARGAAHLNPDGRLDADDWRYRDQDDWRREDGYATGEFATGDHDFSYEGGWPPAGDGASARMGGPPDPGPASPGRLGEDGTRSQLFGQIAIYTLLEDRVAEFDRLSGRVVEQVRALEPDTLVFIVHAVPSAPMQRILYEVYRSRDAYQRHREQPHVQQFEADRRPYVLATNVIELGLQQAKVSPFPSVAELFGEPGYDTSGFERPDYLRDYGRTGPREHR